MSGLPEKCSCPPEVLLYYQQTQHFAQDQRLRLETTGWRVLDFYGNQLSGEELERQRGKLMESILVVCDCEHPFAEDLTADGSGVVDTKMPVLTKVSWLVDPLKRGGAYRLVEILWAHFVLTATRVSAKVAWSRGEFVVGSVNFRSQFVSFQVYIDVLLLVDHLKKNSAPKGASSGWVESSSQFVQFGIRGARMTGCTFLWTSEKDTFRRFVVAVSDRFFSNAIHEMSMPGSFLAAVSGSASLVAVYYLKCRPRKVLLQRKTLKCTRERWFGADTVASSAADEAAPHTTVRIFDVVKVGDFQYIDEHHKLCLLFSGRSVLCPGKSKKRGVSVNPVVAKKQLSVTNPSASHPAFEVALEKSLEESGARKIGFDWRNAPLFQGKQTTINCLYVYRLLAFVVSRSLNWNAVAVLCT